MNDNDALDASIPILTEIIEQEQDFAGEALIPEPSAPLTASRTEAADPVEVQAVTALSDNQWQALELQISERVLRQLQTRIDFVLEHRLRDGLADTLQLALEGITADIKRGLHQTLEDVIARAVAQEIAKLQTNQNKLAEDPAEN
ncbi:MAG: hypothetical protein ABI575_04220 [Oxalobacteraceae bacterium]